MKSTMKNSNHPTPQPSGRTAEEILVAYGGVAHPKPINKREAQRQLFNAICSEVIKEDEPIELEPDPDDFATTETDLAAEIRNQLRAELRERLAVFFGQDSEKK